jgi:hypothetical protein
MKPSSSTSAAHVRKPSPPPEMVAGFSYGFGAANDPSFTSCDNRKTAVPISKTGKNALPTLYEAEPASAAPDLKGA